jgi:putative oxidoreductase
MRAYLHPLARALMALIFLVSGFGKITGFDETAGMMAGEGMPAPALLLVGAIAVELIAGLALLVGYKARWAALLLVLYLIPATLIFHARHMFDPGQAGRMQTIHVLKNLAIMGGLLKFLADGAGAYSLDNKRAASALDE